MIEIGRKRTRILVQSPTDSPDSYGDSFERTYATVGESWASVVAVSARERSGGTEAEGDTTHKVFFRYRDDYAALNHKWRIVEKYGAGRVFDIVGNRGPDPKLKEVELMARVRDA